MMAVPEFGEVLCRSSHRPRGKIHLNANGPKIKTYTQYGSYLKQLISYVSECVPLKGVLTPSKCKAETDSRSFQFTVKVGYTWLHLNSISHHSPTLQNT